MLRAARTCSTSEERYDHVRIASPCMRGEVSEASCDLVGKPLLVTAGALPIGSAPGGAGLDGPGAGKSAL